jgi:hypothetical protein
MACTCNFHPSYPHRLKCLKFSWYDDSKILKIASILE